MNFRLTAHAERVILDKGFHPYDVQDALENPQRITNVNRHPGQQRYCGSGLAVVVDGDRVITVYQDRVITPMREDQRNDMAAINSKRLNRKG